MATSPNLNAAAIALNRFGLGARADDTPPADPKGWLLAQFEQYQPRPAAWASQPDSVALSSELAQQRMQLNQLNRQAQQNVSEGAAASQTNAPASMQTAGQANQGAPDTATQTAKQAERKALRGEILDMYRSSVNARVASALTTETPFIERLVHFWANHFAVSTEKPAVAGELARSCSIASACSSPGWS